MRQLYLACVASGLLLQSVSAAPAASVTSWVASTGSDANACTRAAPCATFAGALGKTPDGGFILCADSGTFGTPGAGLTITQGIEIDCRDHRAVIEITASSGVVINVTDPAHQSVTIRGVTINGRLGAGSRANVAGIAIQAAQTVTLDHCLVEQFAMQGLIDTRTPATNSTLQLTESSFAGNTGAGIVLAMTPNSFAISVNIDHVYSGYNAFGIAVANGNRARITNSHFPYDATGVEVDYGGQVALSHSIIDYSSTAAIQNLGTLVVGASDITYVNTVFSGGGATYTNGNSRINFYGSLGVSPTVLPASQDHGQQ